MRANIRGELQIQSAKDFERLFEVLLHRKEYWMA